MDKVGFLKNQISNAGSQIIGVSFVKKDNSIRHMAFRTGIYKDQVKGSNPETTAKINATLTENGMIRVGDMNKGTFRTVNLNTVKRIRINGFTTTF
jgi:hypothetical protein